MIVRVGAAFAGGRRRVKGLSKLGHGESGDADCYFLLPKLRY